MAAPDWKGLLQWSLKNQSGEPTENPRELSEEDKKWLEDALASASVDIGQQITSMKSILDHTGPETDVITHQKEDVLDGLMEIVENIDYARDLTRIGGMQTLMRLLSDKQASVRWRAAEVIATCAQLNEPVQQEYLEADAISKLLQLLSDKDPTCRQKSLLAISCLVRNNEEGLDRFLSSEGTNRLIAVSANDVPRNQRKALQLLSYIASEQPSEISASKIIKLVPQLLGSTDQDVCEAAVVLLTKLSSNFEEHKILSNDPNFLKALDEQISDLEQSGQGDDDAGYLQNLNSLRNKLNQPHSPNSDPPGITQTQGRSTGSNVEANLNPPLLLC